jgi:hypothetical protein
MSSNVPAGSLKEDPAQALQVGSAYVGQDEC